MYFSCFGDRFLFIVSFLFFAILAEVKGHLQKSLLDLPQFNSSYPTDPGPNVGFILIVKCIYLNYTLRDQKNNHQWGRNTAESQ